MNKWVHMFRFLGYCVATIGVISWVADKPFEFTAILFLMAIFYMVAAQAEKE